MVIFFETKITNWKRLLIKIFSGGIVHCYLGFKQYDKYLIYDFDNGVLSKRYIKNPKGIAVNIDTDVIRAIKVADRYIGKRYDWKAIVGLALRLKLHNRNRIICSEFVLQVLKEIGYYKGETLLSPNKTFKRINDARKRKNN